MMEFGKKLPIGIQNFERLRTDGYLYVDKTAYIYELVYGSGVAFFLSRPRRFGKSLFLSTLRAYWEGKKELFQGLSIEKLEEGNKNAWEAYPVFYFDFNTDNFRAEGGLENVIERHLQKWEKQYAACDSGKTLAGRFQDLLIKANETANRRAVVLVDEYDKPLLENGGTDDRMEHDKAVFKGFFSTLKSYEEYIRFTFFTGVTKFSKVSIFSDLNHLSDISLDARYAGICGITEDELHAHLSDRIEEIAKKSDLTTGECYEKLKKMYDGYHFYRDAVGVYNPFSLLNALEKQDFRSWWFETGTPTFLVEKLASSQYDIKKITSGSVYASGSNLSDYRADNPNPVPLLYQSGYLTIIDYDKRREIYRLGYPNEEVKYGFLECLAPAYLHEADESKNSLDIYTISEYIETGDTDGLRDVLVSLYARLPYTADERPVEQNFQNVVYLVFMLLGKFVRTEVHTARGRSDIVVETDEYVYVMEFKRDGSADDALRQIEENGYTTPYEADKRTLIKIGANFDSKTRALDEWKVE